MPAAPLLLDEESIVPCRIIVNKNEGLYLKKCKTIYMS